MGELGFDSQLRSSGVLDYQNPTWDIDGIRHLLIPTVSYRYIPEQDWGHGAIPDIDADTFTTYLRPLELGDARAIDALGETNTLRMGFDNILETRQTGYGSASLLDFNLADDLNFHRTEAEPDFSDLHTELVLTPAHWIEFDLANLFKLDDFAMREVDSGVILRDGDVRTYQFSTDFLRHEDDDYSFIFTQRINEQFSATVLAEYGARLHILNTVQLGLVENIANTWSVRYLIDRNGGPNREGRFGSNVEVDVVKF